MPNRKNDMNPIAAIFHERLADVLLNLLSHGEALKTHGGPFSKPTTCAHRLTAMNSANSCLVRNAFAVFLMFHVEAGNVWEHHLKRVPN
jgi:hypothetical protein